MIAHNPVIPGFHPDPSIIRVEDTYYIANSTFEWFPGVTIHRSENLRDWELITCPLDRADMLDLRGVLNGGGVWAPCLSYDNGIFYLVFSIVKTVEEQTQDTINYLTTAKDIRGPWSAPVRLNSGGFDASLFHDSNGSKWLVQMRWDFRPGRNRFRGIFLQEYSESLKKLIGKSQLIFEGTERGFTEGPHIYRRKGYYYLMTAEGGTRDGHCITMARSKNLCGPYETDKNSPLLSSSDSPEWPIQYAGHGDLVEDKKGNWYLVHLGVRRGLTGGYSVLGRETFLETGFWGDDDWFHLTKGTLPQESVCLPEPDDETEQESGFYRKYVFDTPTLDIHFSSLRIPLTEKEMSLTERPGFLRLYGGESILSKHRQVMAGRRIEDISFTAETEIFFEPENYQQLAGITLFYNTANFYYCFISRNENGRFCQLMIRDAKKTTWYCEKEIPLPCEGSVRFRILFRPEGIQFLYGTTEKLHPVNGEQELLPVKILSDEYATISEEQGFTGTFIGLCCQDISGMGKSADFAYLNITKY